MTESQSNATETPEGTDTSTDAAEAATGAPTASDDPLKALKDESAQRRIENKDLTAKVGTLTDKLRALTIQFAAGEIITNPSDHMAWSDDWNDDDGNPDPEKIKIAAQELADQKPYLARVRGSVGQGEHSDGPQQAMGIGELLRLASRG